ncbi:methyltransferase domain-containing protein [Candidatus Woesebacteria bacterium]|nr:MAG: methyltransferase domain-containing protein [Candidatus Woesebacteria bacterium]
MKFIAYTVKGLEEIAKDELFQLTPNAEVLEVGPKRIIFEIDEAMPLLKLTTVDDIGLLVSQYKGINIDEITSNILELNFGEAKDKLRDIRKIEDTFSVTVSKARTQIDTNDLQVKIANALIDKYKWEYTQLDHTTFDVRVFIDKKDIYVSVRLTEKPLFHRTYKVASVIGALKPTIASAMVRLAIQGTKGLVVDSFCGSGTILAEALGAGNEVYGGDISGEAIEVCKTTLRNMGYEPSDKIKEQDATKTNWPDNYFDFAISNLPWDKQIKIDSVTNLYIGTLSEYARMVKPLGSICLLVSNPDLLVKLAKKYFPNRKIGKLTIGVLGQKPTIVTIS